MLPESVYWVFLIAIGVGLVISLSRRHNKPVYFRYQILAIGCTPIAKLLDRYHHRLAGIVVFIAGGLLLPYVTTSMFVDWRKRREDSQRVLFGGMSEGDDTNSA
jgi:hypothetical protein